MKHQNLFVTIVGLAAWIHSTWSFSVIIGGEVPALLAWTDLPHWLYWVVPGAAAAAAVDVGLISLASQFRTGRSSRAKLVTFAVLSFISYLGQALFSLSHGGKYIASTGLSGPSIAMASVVWELLIWLLPAALPLVLILWAWSDMLPVGPTERIVEREPLPGPATSGLAVIEKTLLASTPPEESETLESPTEYSEKCTLCDYTVTKLDARSARNAIIAHGRVHSPKPLALSPNGVKHEE